MPNPFDTVRSIYPGLRLPWPLSKASTGETADSRALCNHRDRGFDEPRSAHLAMTIAALREENHALRTSAEVFGALAERLARQLRSEKMECKRLRAALEASSQEAQKLRKEWRSP